MAKRILIIVFGSRGDIQPLCLLGQALQRAGHDVRVIANSDYERSIAGFGLDFVDVGLAFEASFREAGFDQVFQERYSKPHKVIGASLAYGRAMSETFAAAIARSAEEIDRSDVIVYATLAYFAGALARERSIPSAYVLTQPVFPTSRYSSTLLSGRDFGRIPNRLSHELMRGLSLLVWPAIRKFRKRTGRGRALKPWTSPEASSLASSSKILAYSEALSGPTDPRHTDVTASGFWFRAPAAGSGLPEEVCAFLAAGPPPVYIGFGSMLFGVARNTELVMHALARWGGRAIIATGGGGLARPPTAPSDVLFVNTIDHALLFPQVAAAVHHGGAGTTAEALRNGLPCVILPVASDQLFWGRRVAELGACEDPIPLGTITPDVLAERIARAVTDPAMRAAAHMIGEKLRQDRGPIAAVERIEQLLAPSGG